MTDIQYTRDWERSVNEFISQPVPETVSEAGERVAIDVISAAIAGSTAPGVESVTTAPSFVDGRATLLGTARQVAPNQAALVNTAAAIAQEIEEGHNVGGHVGASIVAGSLPIAETRGIDGRTFVDAVVRSYEVTTRLEYALFAMKDRINDEIPWLLRDPHSTWTTVGPALTVAQLLDVSPAVRRETLRIATNLAVVSMFDPYQEGAPARNFTAGFSAQAGMQAALLADAGVLGSAAALETVYDPFEAMLDDGFSSLFDSLGTDWWITENYHKPYPSCRYTHPALDALREAIDGRNVDPAAIGEIDVFTFANAVDMDDPAPETFTGGKFSIPYVLARYVRSGSVRLDHFGPDQLADPAVRELAAAVSLHRDAEFEAQFPTSWGARVRVHTATGDSLVGERRFPRGDHRDPLSEAAFRRRTTELLEWGLDTEDVTDAVAALFSLSTTDIQRLVARLH